MPRLAFLFVVLFAFHLLNLSCDSSPTPEEPVVQVNPHERSEAIYQKSCASCHGIEIAAFADRKWKHGFEKDSIVALITNGLPDTAMHSYGSLFTAGEIDSLADYILTIKDKVDAYKFEGQTDTTGIFKSDDYTLRLDTVVSDLKSPWGLAFLPGGDLLVSDKSGVLYEVKQDGSKTEIKGVPEVLYEGQGGLLDVKTHPDFETNQWVYLAYSTSMKEGEDVLATTVIVRAKLEGGRLSQIERIFEALPYLATRHHYGCRMEFGTDGKLYLSVGDRGKRDENPQSLDKYPGKIHRINDDGSVPNDNPFINQENAIASIYSYGHRNPQGMDIHPSTGDVWTHEHGPRGGDEINIIRKGQNYGWPVISYGINYSGTTFTNIVEKEGMEQPLHYWVPSIGPSGMAFISGDRYPKWKGNLLVGSLKYRFLDRVVLDGDKVVEEESLLKKIGRLRSVEMGPDGYIYVGVEGSPAFVARLIPMDK